MESEENLKKRKLDENNVELRSELVLESKKLKEEIKLKNKIINELKDDLIISLKHNDTYNLEIRKLKLYNFLFKFIGTSYVTYKILKYYKKY